jgi:small-conductance mechanosensitive channel
VEPETPPEEEQLIITPTLRPTSTPGPLNEVIGYLADAAGLNRRAVLGLTGEDWINLLVSLLIALVGITVLARLLYRLLQWAASKTSLAYDDLILDRIRNQVIWLLWVLVIQRSVNRLLFLRAEFKSALNQHFFTLYVLIIAAMAWKLIDLGIEWYQGQHERQSQRPNPFIPLMRRVAGIFLMVTALIMVLNNYGINITALVAVLGIGGLAFSLAAQDTLADAISGFIILWDQPFREGDRIGIEGLDTWGDVVEIGTRTTRIRTLDNRMVIVPNSAIAKSQIVNYTYPDPRYRVQIEIGVEYGVKLPGVRQIISAAVRQIEGVLPDKPIDVLFLEFGNNSLILRVRWWISSYVDTRRMFDKVNEAIYEALLEAGIELPPDMYDVRITREPSPDNAPTEESQPQPD